MVPPCSLALLLSLPLLLAVPQEGSGNVLDGALMAPNSVPMMGRKRAPMQVPSFTGGFMPAAYPKFLRLRTSKREGAGQEKRAPWTGAWANIMASKPASMYQNSPGKRAPWTSSWANILPVPAGKRAPWTSSWANIMAKPAAMYQNNQGKRALWNSSWENLMTKPDANQDKRAPWTSSWANIMTKPAAMYQNNQGKRGGGAVWGVGVGKRTAQGRGAWGYDNLLRAPQGFRFHSGGQDYLARDLMFKRDPEQVIDSALEQDDESEETKEKKDAAPSLDTAEVASSSESGSESEEQPEQVYTGLDWASNFESLMADASLVSSALPHVLIDIFTPFLLPDTLPPSPLSPPPANMAPSL